MELPIVTIDPKDFIGFVPEDLFNAFDIRDFGEEAIRSFCTTVNKFRQGIPVECFLYEYRFKRMTFHNCVVTRANGEEFTIKSHKNHINLWGSDCTIWLTEERQNRLEVSKNEIKWVCVKDSGKVFPKCGIEFLKIKYGDYGIKNVTQLLCIYDNYVKVFIDTYKEHMAKAS